MNTALESTTYALNDTTIGFTMTTPLDNDTYVQNQTSLYSENETISTILPDTKTWKYGPYEAYTLFWVGYWIEEVYLRILNGIGIPGNAAALITILFLKPISSSSLYIAFLAIVDSLALIALLVDDEVSKRNIPKTHTGCRISYFFGTSIIMISNWTLVCTTVERFIAIWFPFQVNRVCTKKNAILVFICIILFFSVLNLHFLFGMVEVLNKSGRPYCDFRDDFQYFKNRIWYYIDFVFFALAPCVILFVCNGLIIYGMQKSQNLQKEMSQKQEQLQEKEKQQRQVAIMLVTISVVFICLVLPNGIWYIYKNYWELDSPEAIARYVFTGRFIRLLSSMNHAVNFYFYFVTGRKFRNKFMEVFFCKTKKRSMYASTSVPGVSQSQSTNISTIPMSTVQAKS